MRAAHGMALAFALLAVGPAALGAELDEELYARLLERFSLEVSDPARTRVDYPGLARSPDWRLLVRSLDSSRPHSLATRAEQLAYWINIYNIFAIDLVVQNQPVEGIKDIGSFLSPVWKREAGRIDGRPYTLHQIEHEILRPMGEPRIHAAIVCASVSCPALRREPWTAARLDAQLDDTLRHWMRDRQKGLAVDRSSGIVRVSRIFDWFEEDFGGRDGVLAFVERYASESDRVWLAGHRGSVRLAYLDYDWNLNDIASGAGTR